MQKINNFTESEVKVIQVPSGTGKSQTIFAIITNALENQNTCFVICLMPRQLNREMKQQEKIFCLCCRQIVKKHLKAEDQNLLYLLLIKLIPFLTLIKTLSKFTRFTE